MFAKQSLSYEPIPLPDRHSMTDEKMAAAAKGFFDTMCRRHSVRDFTDRPVPQTIIEDCVRAAGRAPSGANHQPWHFVAIGDPEKKHLIRLAAEEEEKNSTMAVPVTNGYEPWSRSGPASTNRISISRPG